MQVIVRPFRPGWVRVVITDDAETTASVAGTRELTVQPGALDAGTGPPAKAVAVSVAREYHYQAEGLWEEREDGSFRIRIVKEEITGE